MAQAIESVFSRVMNGNFSHGTSYWEKVATDPNSEIRVDIQGDVHGAGPPDPASPRYLLLAKGWFKHLFQYKDLAIYPSRLRFDDVILTPVSIGEFHLEVVDYDRYSLGARPFSVYHRDTDSWLFIENGRLIDVWDDDGSRGIYRLNSVFDEGRDSKKALIAPVNPKIDYVLTNEDFVLAYTYASSYDNMFKLKYDPNEAAKVPGFTGFNPGDYFISDGFGGIIISVQPVSGIVWVSVNTSIGQRIPPVTSDTDPDNSFTTMSEWKVMTQVRGSFAREVKAVLYDLTLVFTTVYIGDFDPASPKILFYDDVDEDLQYGEISPVKIDGSNTYFKKLVNPGIERWFYRLLQEAPEPYEGDAELWMKALDSHQVKMGDVALYRGNYTQRMKKEDTSATEEVIDYLESPINVESGIIPKGTVFAYVGGSVCPPGFEQTKGLGGIDGSSLLEPNDLRVSIGDNWYLGSEVNYRYGEDKPRTIIRIDDLVGRPVIGPSLPFQVSRRLVEVIPWSYGEGHHYYHRWLAFRSQIGNPEPEWVREEYLRIDVVPGYILEFYFPTEDRSVYAIITQVMAGQFAHTVKESFWHDVNENFVPGRYPRSAGDNEITWDWREALNNNTDENHQLRNALGAVHAGVPKNRAFQGYGIYGDFDPTLIPSSAIEVLGDFSKFVFAASIKGARLRIWKSGVLAHAQRVQELDIQTPFGGYGYLGEPHTHLTDESDDLEMYREVGHAVSTRPFTSQIKIPASHTHGGLFGATSIPKIRPVILCQKK